MIFGKNFKSLARKMAELWQLVGKRILHEVKCDQVSQYTETWSLWRKLGRYGGNLVAIVTKLFEDFSKKVLMKHILKKRF